MRTLRPIPGREWTLRTRNKDKTFELRQSGGYVFDELYVDDWFGMEQMDTRHWWFRIGSGLDGQRRYMFGVYLPRRGPVKLINYALGDMRKLMPKGWKGD